MHSTSPEAFKVVLTPIDTSQLHHYGLRITREEIRTTRDEKQELLNRTLQQGEDVTIEYIIDGIRAEVVYRVFCLESNPAYVGRRTTVIIEGESNPGVTSRRYKGGYTLELRSRVRASMQGKFDWLQEEIELCESYGLCAEKLISEANSLIEYLKDFW